MWGIVKLLQIVEETSYGQKVTASPSYNLAGLRVYMQETTKATAERYRKEGSRDIYKMLKTGEAYAFAIKCGIIDTRLLRYGTELPGGTGTIEKSLNFMYSKLMNNAGALQEQYKFYLGARCDRTELEIAGGVINLSQNWICQSITPFNATSGLTTPTFASAPTQDAWTALTGGSGQLTIGGTVYDTTRAKFTVNQKLEALKPNGESQIKMLWPTDREVLFEFDTWHIDETWFNAVKNLSNHATLVYTLNSTGPKTVTLGNIKFDDHDITDQSGSGRHTLQKVSGVAENIQVTA